MTTDKIGRFTADGLPVLIGSVPLDSHRKALDWIFEATPEIPLWPQLPVNPWEQMLSQFAEGLPCIVEEKRAGSEGRIYYDISRPGFEEAMLDFYEEYLVVSEHFEQLPGSRFQTSEQRAFGLYLFAGKLSGQSALTAVKGQVTGPFTMLTGIKDTRGRAGYFDDTIRDMVIKSIAMTAAWQTGFLAGHSSKPILVFIDEPALAGLGSSAFIGVTTAEIKEMINEVAGAIHRAGGLAGIHVCANTDWSLLLNSSIDILSFDAYGFFDRIAPFKNEISGFLDRNGIIAWGGVPTSRAEDINRATGESLVELWESQAASLTGVKRDKAAVLRQTLITPSCGTGSLTPESAKKVLDLTREVSSALRTTYLGKDLKE